MTCYFRIIVSQFRNLNFLESNICCFPVQRFTNCCINNSSSDGAYLYCYEDYSCCLLRAWCPTQSRQSAKRFSSRWNWVSPTPLAAGECAPPPFGPGGGHTRLRLQGWGSPNFNEGTCTVVLYIHKYFVVPGMLQNSHRILHLKKIKINMYFILV
jgi:hypothetical protein